MAKQRHKKGGGTGEYRRMRGKAAYAPLNEEAGNPQRAGKFEKPAKE
jgi:hypothetical protein